MKHDSIGDLEVTSLITRDRIHLQVQASDWIEAIQQGAEPLLRDGLIGAEYVDAIFESFAKNGDYMIVIPEVVLSHARPELGARGTGISLITLREPVLYLDDPEKPITVIFTLAATDGGEHIEMMQALAEILVDDEALDQIKTATDVDDVLSILTSAAS